MELFLIEYCSKVLGGEQLSQLNVYSAVFNSIIKFSKGTHFFLHLLFTHAAKCLVFSLDLVGVDLSVLFTTPTVFDTFTASDKRLWKLVRYYSISCNTSNYSLSSHHCHGIGEVL